MPPVGTRSFFGPTRAHYKQGMVLHILSSDSSAVVGVQLEKAPAAVWPSIMKESFDLALLDIPQLSVELGLYDALLAAPPAGDGKLPSRLKPWIDVYASPPERVTKLCSHFISLATQAGKVPGVLLGDATAAGLYSQMGFRFLSVGSDLMVMGTMLSMAIQKQVDNPTHTWDAAPVDPSPDATRSASFHTMLETAVSELDAGVCLPDQTYDSLRSVRPAPLVLVDTTKDAFASPALLSSALRSLDGPGHRLVRILSASEANAPMTATIALNLGADSVVVPVTTLAEARDVAASKAFKAGHRSLNIHPELPFHVAKTPTAGVELLSLVEEAGEIIGCADFVLASAACWRQCYGTSYIGELTKLELMCRTASKRLLLLADVATGAARHRIGEAIVIGPPAEQTSNDAALEARNAKLQAFKQAMHSDGKKTLGEINIAASPTVSACCIAQGLDWIWIEWQHAPLDFTTFQALCRAINQRGGISVVRVAGYHDRTGIQQCLDAGVDVLLIPYVQTLEEAQEGIKHCLFAPKGDRVHNGSYLSTHKKPLLMFQLETSKCIDNLKEMYDIPEVDFGFIGPGDLAVSMGLLRTRDGLPEMMNSPELKWCYKYIVDTVNRAGKVTGGFTRGGDPSTLLQAGFAMVALGHDGMDAMAGCELIMSGASTIPAVKGPPGLTTKVKYSRNASKLIPSMPSIYGCTKFLPSILGHVLSVKNSKAPLLLPKLMPKDVSHDSTVDMEKAVSGGASGGASEVAVRAPVKSPSTVVVSAPVEPTSALVTPTKAPPMPTPETVPAPVPVPVPAPLPAPVPAPVSEPVPEPVPEPTPVTEPAAEPVAAAPSTPIAEPIAEVASVPAAEPPTKTATPPAAEPVANAAEPTIKGPSVSSLEVPQEVKETPTASTPAHASPSPSSPTRASQRASALL